MGATSMDPLEDDQRIGPANGSREQPDPSSDALYSLLQAAASDSFATFPTPPASTCSADGNGHRKTSATKSILRKGLMNESIIEDLRHHQGDRLREYNAMVAAASTRTNDDDDTAVVPSLQSSTATPDSSQTDDRERSKKNEIAPTDDKLLVLLRTAVSEGFHLPKNDELVDDGRAGRSRRNLARHQQETAGNLLLLQSAVSDVHSEQKARMDEYRTMHDVAMSRSADDNVGADDDNVGVGVSNLQMLGFMKAAASPSPAGTTCVPSKVAPPSELRTVYRTGHGLSTEVASLRREISKRAEDEQRAICPRGYADAKSTSPPKPKPQASRLSKEELLAMQMAAVSQDFAVSNADSDPVKKHPVARQTCLRRTDPGDELSQEMRTRLAEHKEMCRVAMSRKSDTDAIAHGGDVLQGTSGMKSSPSPHDAPSTPPPGDIISILTVASSDEYVRIDQGRCRAVPPKSSLLRSSRSSTLREEVMRMRNDLSERQEEYKRMCEIAKTRCVERGGPSENKIDQKAQASAKIGHNEFLPSAKIAHEQKEEAMPSAPSVPVQPKPASLGTPPRTEPKPASLAAAPPGTTGLHFGMTAPRFTEEEEAREKASLTAEEKAEAEASIYGRKLPPTPPVSEHDSLEELELELRKIPEEQKADFLQAEAKCPEIAKDEALLLHFLRCPSVNFDAKTAARRVVAYWKRRVELFGQDKAFLPLSVEVSLADDGEALATGAYRILPDADDSGRRVIVYGVRRQKPDLYPRESMLRVFWYMVHATLEKHHANSTGYVFLLLPTDGTNEVFDRKLCKFMVDLDSDCLPAQITAWHHLHSTPLLPLYSPFWKHQLGPRIRRVLTVHSSEPEDNVQLLSQCGLTSDRLPSALGGEVELDHVKWLKDRRNRGI